MKTLLNLQELLYFFMDLPLRIWNIILRFLGKKGVFSNNQSTSDSDSTYYSNVVSLASTSEKVFRKFRRNFYYRQILEHVDYRLGLNYLQRLSDFNILNLTKHPGISLLSVIGSPRRFYFKGVGLISPTLIRYQYVNQELNRYFGSMDGFRIAEIGIGFGGQYAVINQNSNIGTYTMYDLPQVMQLTQKLLTKAGVDCSKIIEGSITNPLTESCDLAISNYAFSELPRAIQKQYIDGVLKNSHRGYLIMNSGRTDISGRSSGKYTLEELKFLLPAFEVVEESPLTGPDNYVILWGHNK
jgi:putative sugar O-methyltransferase